MPQKDLTRHLHDRWDLRLLYALSFPIGPYHTHVNSMKIALSRNRAPVTQKPWGTKFAIHVLAPQVCPRIRANEITRAGRSGSQKIATLNAMIQPTTAASKARGCRWRSQRIGGLASR